MSVKQFETVEQLLEYQATLEGRAVAAAATPTQIEYVIGDATAPGYPTVDRFICHVCNDVGAWGRGFTRSLSSLSPEPERRYRDALKQLSPHPLGGCTITKVNPSLFVANMIAQHGLPTRAKRVVIDYPALEMCLEFVGKVAADWGVSCHMPRIGCGIAGGDWHVVSEIIERTLCAKGVRVFVYDLPPSDRDN